MAYGGSRSGKTFELIRTIIVRASKVESRHIILRHTFNACKTSIWLDTLPKVLNICFPDLPVKWNRSDYYIKLPNNSEVWIGGMGNEKEVEKILGKEYSTIYFNECSQLQYGSIQIAITRLAQKNLLIKRVFYDQNPPSKKHWSYWLFEKKVDPMSDEMLSNPEDYQSFLMNPKDNIENIDEDYLELLAKMPEKERMRFLEGQYVDGDDGLAYYAFDPEVHISECKRQPGSMFIGMDFNVQPGVATIFQYRSNTFYFLDEIWIDNNSDTYKIVAELKKRGYYGTVIADSTGANRRTSGKSDFDILKQAGYTIKYKQNPYVTDRVTNANRLFTDNRIVVDPKCKKLINDFNKVSWKDNKLDQKTDKSLTHMSDAATYGLWALDPIQTKSDARIKIY